MLSNIYFFHFLARYSYSKSFQSSSLLQDISQAPTDNVQDQFYSPQVSTCVAVSKDDVHELKFVALSILRTVEIIATLCHKPQSDKLNLF